MVSVSKDTLTMPFSHLLSTRFFVVGFMWLFVGCGGALFAELWWRSSAPHVIEVHSVDIAPITTGVGGYTLLVTASGPPAKDCLRFTQHALYRDQTGLPGELTNREPWLMRNYVPLATAVNGVGFSSVAYFTVTLFVPPDVPHGKWVYTIRSVYWCTVFPGFTRFTESTNGPIVIDLK